MLRMPSLPATLSAAAFAHARPPCETAGARLSLPLSGGEPAGVQPIVPLRAPWGRGARAANGPRPKAAAWGGVGGGRAPVRAPGPFTPVGIETREYSS